MKSVGAPFELPSPWYLDFVVSQDPSRPLKPSKYFLLIIVTHKNALEKTEFINSKKLAKYLLVTCWTLCRSNSNVVLLRNMFGSRNLDYTVQQWSCFVPKTGRNCHNTLTFWMGLSQCPPVTIYFNSNSFTKTSRGS
jgi:hypothetical protein